MIVPEKLKRNDTVAIVSLSSVVWVETTTLSIDLNWGKKIRRGIWPKSKSYGKHIERFQILI